MRSISSKAGLVDVGGRSWYNTSGSRARYTGVVNRQSELETCEARTYEDVEVLLLDEELLELLELLEDEVELDWLWVVDEVTATEESDVEVVVGAAAREVVEVLLGRGGTLLVEDTLEEEADVVLC